MIDDDAEADGRVEVRKKCRSNEPREIGVVICSVVDCRAAVVMI